MPRPCKRSRQGRAQGPAGIVIGRAAAGWAGHLLCRNGSASAGLEPGLPGGRLLAERQGRADSNTQLSQSLPAGVALHSTDAPGTARGLHLRRSAQAAGRRRPSHRHQRWRAVWSNRWLDASQAQTENQMSCLICPAPLAQPQPIRPFGGFGANPPPILSVFCLPSCAANRGAVARRLDSPRGRIHMLNGDRSGEAGPLMPRCGAIFDSCPGAACPASAAGPVGGAYDVN